MIKRLMHLNVITSDIEKSLHFYVDLLGGHILGNYKREIIINRTVKSSGAGIALGLGEKAEYKGWLIRFGYDKRATNIDIIEWVNPPSTGKPYDKINHIGIVRMAVEVDNIDEVYQDLRAKGVEFISPPQFMDLAPDRPVDGLIKFATCFDPDGIAVSLEQLSNLRSKV
ncbi:MAG: VOC family protein [Promethearchaeota archaeon]|jgi:catechol 2,3-dioxygenase-like lactoylglutathione lyase family enzyme